MPIPKHFSVFLLSHEAPPEELSALDYVIKSAQDEIVKLEQAIEDVVGESV